MRRRDGRLNASAPFRLSNNGLCVLHLVDYQDKGLSLTPLLADSQLQHTATHRNTLQHSAIHHNTLQHTAPHMPDSKFADGQLCSSQRPPLSTSASTPTPDQQEQRGKENISMHRQEQFDKLHLKSRHEQAQLEISNSSLLVRLRRSRGARF